MAFIKFLFYLLIFLIIKSAEIIYLVPEVLAKLVLVSFKRISFMLRNIKKTFSPNSKSTKKRRYAKKNSTIRQNRIVSVAIFKNTFKSLGNFFAKLTYFTLLVIKALISEILSFFQFIISIIFFPLRIFRRKPASTKAKTKKKAYKTTFLYKFKYIFIGSFTALFLFFIPAVFYIFISDLPDLSNINLDNIPKSTKIFDRNGVLLYEIYANQNRTIVPLEKIPKHLVDATIAIEDKDFYKHHGFDLSAMARAFYVNLQNDKVQGGSTITQQLIKSALLTPELSITRKVKELVLAYWAEEKYSKNEILEFYFNYIPYGGTAWGVEAASQIYFGKNVSDLTLAESAYLAGLPQAPGNYNPFGGDSKRGKVRQKEVLNAMVSSKYITQNDAENAFKEELAFKSSDIQIKAPHFVMYVKDLLIKEYGIYRVEKGGLFVKTTLDLKLHEEAQKIVTEEVEKSRGLGVGNGAALVTNPQSGDVYAMVGSRDYFDSENDGNVNITTSLRQPGSTIKVVPYTLALTQGLTEATILEDTPLTINTAGSPPYTPVNYDGRFHGRVPLRLAFANSFNIPAVRVAQRLGVGEIVDFGKKMGITSWGEPSNYGVSIALGAAEVTMVELSTAYGVIANEGDKVDINPILEIKDSNGNEVYKKEVREEKVVNPGIAFIISDILADNRARSMAFGTNTPLVIPGHRVSVKTGTTDNKRDNWTVGFTPNVLVATWVGNNDNRPLSQALASGITGAAPMWNRIITKALETEEFIPAKIPENVIGIKCYGYDAYFIRGTEANQCRSRFSDQAQSSPENGNNRGNNRRDDFWERIFRP